MPFLLYFLLLADPSLGFRPAHPVYPKLLYAVVVHGKHLYVQIFVFQSVPRLRYVAKLLGYPSACRGSVGVRLYAEVAYEVVHIHCPVHGKAVLAGLLD